MEKYIVSARKYRPATFDTLVGQQALAHTLKSAIRSGRLAHAYLFCGPRGVGKTSCARIFAKTINCTNPTETGEACGECESCKAFNEGRSYNIMELDAASNNAVDDIRELTDQVRIPPPVGKYRVYIIDEVHMLTTSAFNAFLKTLEEPPAHAIFILATTEKQKILPTILSRCQIYDFTRILVPDIVKQLQYIAETEGIKAEAPALNIIAQKADGAMRDALSIFDQVAASSENNITYRSAIESLNVLDYEYYFKLVDAFLSGDVPQTLLIYKEIRDHGFDSLFFINGLAQHLRDLMVATDASTVKLLEKSDDVAVRYIEQSKKCNPRWLYRAMDLCNRCDLDYRVTNNKQFLVELTLIKLCQINAPDPTRPDSGIKKIDTTGTTQQTSATTSTQSATKPQAAVHPPSGTSVAKKEEIPKTPPVNNGHGMVADVATSYQPKSKPKSATPSISSMPRINVSMSPHVSVQASTNASPSTGVSNTYSDDDFMKAWNNFMVENPKEKLLTSVLSCVKPKRVANSYNYTIEVDNVGMLDVINQHKGRLVEFLHESLRNNAITLNVVLNENSPRLVIKSPQETVADMMTRNQNFKMLVETFKLGLA